jgi:hypothetical protein
MKWNETGYFIRIKRTNECQHLGDKIGPTNDRRYTVIEINRARYTQQAIYELYHYGKLPMKKRAAQA